MPMLYISVLYIKGINITMKVGNERKEQHVNLENRFQVGFSLCG